MFSLWKWKKEKEKETKEERRQKKTEEERLFGLRERNLYSGGQATKEKKRKKRHWGSLLVERVKGQGIALDPRGLLRRRPSVLQQQRILGNKRGELMSGIGEGDLPTGIAGEGDALLPLLGHQDPGLREGTSRAEDVSLDEGVQEV